MSDVGNQKVFSKSGEAEGRKGITWGAGGVGNAKESALDDDIALRAVAKVCELVNRHNVTGNERTILVEKSL